MLLAIPGLALAIAGEARADHGAVGTPAPQRSFARTAEPETALSVEASTTSFDNDGVGGTFYTAAANAEYWRAAFGVHVRLPVHTLSMNTALERTTGVGDLVVGGTYAVHRSPLASIGVGLDVHLPTGDSDQGLGAGAVALAPNARAVRGLPAQLALYGAAGAIINTTSGEPTSFTEQRADAELRFGSALAWQASRVRLGAQLQSSIPLAPSQARGVVYVTAGPSIALSIDHHWWLNAFTELPIGNQRAFDWRAGFAVGYSLGAGHTHEESP